MEHVREIMIARHWDELGHRPPKDWYWRCSCGAVSEGYLAGQIEALNSWAAHRAEGDQ